MGPRPWRRRPGNGCHYQVHWPFAPFRRSDLPGLEAGRLDPTVRNRYRLLSPSPVVCNLVPGKCQQPFSQEPRGGSSLWQGRQFCRLFSSGTTVHGAAVVHREATFRAARLLQRLGRLAGEPDAGPSRNRQGRCRRVVYEALHFPSAPRLCEGRCKGFRKILLLVLGTGCCSAPSAEVGILREPAPGFSQVRERGDGSKVSRDEGIATL